MPPSAPEVEELATRTEDEVREHLAQGKLVEGLQHMSPEYLRGIRRILTVSADTELVSAPSYLRAAQHAPALNNFGSAISIIQDELAHAHIGYRLLGDLGVDMNRLIYEREPRRSSTRTPSTSRSTTGASSCSPTRSTTRPGSSCSPTSTGRARSGPWKRALAKVDKEETFHLRHGRTWVKKLAADPAEKAQAPGVAGLDVHPHARVVRPARRPQAPRHPARVRLQGDDERRAAPDVDGEVVPFMEEVGLHVPAHWDEGAERWVIDCPFPARFDEERKRWLLEDGRSPGRR